MKKCIEEREMNNCIDTQSNKVVLKVSPINRRQGAKTLMIDELICATVIGLFDNKWSFPLWLELSFHLVCDDDDWVSKHEDMLAFPEDSLFD
jgi:hypothetical protein